jgi:hypothetical protein
MLSAGMWFSKVVEGEGAGQWYVAVAWRALAGSRGGVD